MTTLPINEIGQVTSPILKTSTTEPLNDASTTVDVQERWFWWICEKARSNSSLRGLSVEHAVALSYELAALGIQP